MAEIIQQEKGGSGKKRAKKILPHMDMTPMVDLMMLLITFFMLTTSLSKSKVMEIILPEKLKDPNAAPPKISASRTLNLILGPNDKIYWYPGGVSEEDYDNLPPVTETDYSAEGVRALLLDRNRALFRKINDFEQQVLEGKIRIPQDSVQSSISQLKRDDDTGPIVLIKAYKEANYGNFVDILDEMNICGIARYTFMDIAWYEELMVERAAGITSSTASTN
ncbi:MAG: biopolymer transporter ExbD [Bacteroidales bacterium]|nr:biopolymer transporter ExbD [Bacteroidales bacterium]